MSTGPSDLWLDFAWDPVKAAANLAKHRVSFDQGASALLDPLAVTLFDAEHSQDEERWFTLGMSSQGKMLAVSHTYAPIDALTVRVRVISAREATRAERQQYEEEPR